MEQIPNFSLLRLTSCQVFFQHFGVSGSSGGSAKDGEGGERRPAPLRAEWVCDLAFKIFLSLNRFLNRMRQVCDDEYASIIGAIFLFPRTNGRTPLFAMF